MDRIQDIDLRELSEFEGPERVFLSLYAGGEAGAQAIERRLDALRTVLADEEDADNDELEHFDRNVELVRGWLEEHPPGEGTTCIFACYALDLLKGYRFDLEMETGLHLGPAPYVRPLAELQDEYQTFAVVAADNNRTRVFLVTGTRQDLVKSIRGDVKSHTKKGGWSQKRYERRRDNELHHYAAEVSDFLARLAERKDFDRIVLIGSEETTLAIEEELDQNLADRLIARDTIDLKAGDEALVEEAFEHYWEAERGAERELWENIRAEYRKSEGLAAVGPEDVLAAVKTGRVEVVLVERDAELPAVRCSECENTTVGSPKSCPFCGANAEVEIDLVDEVTRQAELTGAWVEYADSMPGLTRVGRVAALLRY